MGNPGRGTHSSEGVAELPGTWLLEAVPRKCSLSIFAPYLEVLRLVSLLAEKLIHLQHWFLMKGIEETRQHCLAWSVQKDLANSVCRTITEQVGTVDPCGAE